jgi:MurNAc alpha-1-phosphate uridylyltransferase
MIKRGFILAAGEGTRLRPHTDTMPKPMVKIAGMPIIDYTIKALEQVGVQDIVVNTCYKAEILEAHLNQRSQPNIIISPEDTRLETGGGIKKALSYFNDEPFYIINGDALWQDPKQSHNGALTRLASLWDSEKMDILLLCMDCNNFEAKEINGDYIIDDNGLAQRDLSKQGTHMFTGIRICHPRIFEDSPEGAFSFLELMDKAEKNGRLYACGYEGQWHHISTAEDLARVDTHYRESANAA